MSRSEYSKTRLRKPAWLKRRLPTGAAYEQVRALLKKSGLHTVCQEALCPNIWECFSRGTATFLIMGPNCTRACRFCAVGHGDPAPLDPLEPVHVAETVQAMGLTYVVITSVTRDDLPDGGAEQFAGTVRALRRLAGCRVEVLTPDFAGSREALGTVLAAQPDVFNHNLETVPRLYERVRPEADYRRSLEVLRRAKESRPEVVTKSGLMLGLGEREEEVAEVAGEFCDLDVHCFISSTALLILSKNLSASSTMDSASSSLILLSIA